VSARPPAGMPPAHAPHGTGNRRNRVILVIAAVLILLVGFEIGLRRVPPDAVEVSFAFAAQGHYVVLHEITDARTVTDLYTRVNDLPPTDVFAVDRCRPRRPDTLMYSFRFTRWGLPIETATLVAQGCSVWAVFRGFLPEVHDDRTGQTQVILSEAHVP
jgi:hypothetical protein